MAFTLEQNVQGAAAYERPINPTSNTGLSLAGNLLEGLDSFARSQVRQDQEEAAAARASLGTQTDRDRQAFGSLLNSARQDLSAGQDPDVVAANYAPEFAVLGLNPEEKAVLEKTLGSGIFAVPVQATTIQDTAVTLWNEQTNSTRLGLFNLAAQEAEANGETLTTEQITGRAQDLLLSDVSQAQASLVAGNLNWNNGFTGNMETLQRFKSVITAALSVEISGGNFNIPEILGAKATFEQMKAQPAFMKPSGSLSEGLWEQMQGEITSIDNLFIAIEDYDSKEASAQSTALMANIISNVAETNVLARLALTNPDAMDRVVAELTPAFTVEMLNSGGSLNNVVSFSDLNFSPEIIQLMGVNSEGTYNSTSPTALLTPSQVFPPELTTAHAETVTDQADLLAAADALRPVMAGTARNPSRARSSESILASPEETEAWMSSVASMSYLLSQAEQPSARNLDALFSNDNLTVLRRLEEKEGGEYVEQAAILRQQMAQALRASSRRYATVGLGVIEKVEAISVNPETLTVELDNSENSQRISQLVDRYYGGDLRRLLREGPAAWENLRKRLVSPENIPIFTTYRDENTLRFGGKFDSYSEEYEQFLEETRFISPYSSDGLLWQRIVEEAEDIAAVELRLQEFRRYEESLRLDTGFQSIIDNATRATDEAGSPEGVQDRINAGEIIKTTLPPAGSTPETAFTIKTQEDFDAVPVGSMFVNPSDGRVYTKKAGQGGL